MLFLFLKDLFFIFIFLFTLFLRFSLFRFRFFLFFSLFLMFSFPFPFFSPSALIRCFQWVVFPSAFQSVMIILGNCSKTQGYISYTNQDYSRTIAGIIVSRFRIAVHALVGELSVIQTSTHTVS